MKPHHVIASEQICKVVLVRSKPFTNTCVSPESLITQVILSFSHEEHDRIVALGIDLLVDVLDSLSDCEHVDLFPKPGR